MTLPDWLLVLLGLLLLLYVYGTWSHGYFVKHKLPFIRPWPVLGNMAPLLFKTTSFSDYMKFVYDQGAGHKVSGFFDFNDPMLVLRDPELIKAVMVKDFEFFTDHKQVASDDDMFGRNLFALKGERWKNMRHTLSPAFTSSKMKIMFQLIAKCGQQMGDHLQQLCSGVADGIAELEVRDFFTKYANDVIATAAFGVHVDSLAQPDNEFYRMGKTATDLSGIKFALASIMPTLMKKLGIELFPKTVLSFFKSLVHDTIALREKEGIVRPDMIHLLMQARKEGKNLAELTNDDITAQAFLFFFAGFDTSSTFLCFTCHYLAVNPDLQDRVRAEVDAVLAEHDGEVTYEGMQQLKYLDAVMAETLRLWPPAITTDRVCVRPYTLAATDTSPAIEMNVGDLVLIPTFGLQRDARFFPDPERFDPERFLDKNKEGVDPFTYMPFGLGPRSCIGMRFAQMEAKIAMMVLISRFRLRAVDKTCHPLRMGRKKFNLMPEDGFWVGIEPRS